MLRHKGSAGLRLVICACSLIAAASSWAVEPGNAERGKYVFYQCRVCHYIEQFAPHGSGPNLYNVFGRTAGSALGFDYYSDALKKSGIVWSPQKLDAWLLNPATYVPGTTMIFPQGVQAASDRADLIAYMQKFTGKTLQAQP